MRIISFSVIFWLLFIFPKISSGQSNSNTVYSIEETASTQLLYPVLVNKLYQLAEGKLIWFNQDNEFKLLREALRDRINNSENEGLKKQRYHLTDLINNAETNFILNDSIAAKKMDRIFSDAAIAYCKDLFQGTGVENLISYDGISAKYEDADNGIILKLLAMVSTTEKLSSVFKYLKPVTEEYSMLEEEMKVDTLSALQKTQLMVSMNLYRWIHHFKFNHYVVVNIAAGMLKFYRYDSIELQMKVVTGKPSSKTPRFAAYCNEIILYPYWNVPESIARKELLPIIKRNPDYVDLKNMQLINSKGQVINHHKINWKKFSKNYFPYKLRQCTGCDNSLGVVKFNLTSPYSVYLHDTNNRLPFLSSSRNYSHGCIRVEKPFELANKILINQIDKNFLDACIKNQVPVPLKVNDPVPVFVIYQCAEADVHGNVQYYKDVYGLFK